MFGSIRKIFRKSEPSAETDGRDASAKTVHVEADDAFLVKEGNAAIGDQRFSEAVDLYQKAISVNPNNSASQIGLGFSLLQLAQFERAIPPIERAIALNARNVDGLYLLGQAYVGIGQTDGAEKAWRTAHQIAPSFEPLYGEYCLLLFSRGNIQAASDLMEEGVSIYPNNASFHFYRGNLLSESGNFAAAAEAYKTARALGAAWPDLLSNFGNALRQTGHLAESIEALKAATDLAPEVPAIFSNYVFSIQYSDKFTRQEKYAAHVEFSNRFETPLMNEWGNYANDPAPNRKLKIGYVSGDFRGHSLAFFIEPVISHHDRANFEIHCYYSHPVHDAVSERIKRLADRWNEVAGMSDADLAQKIRADQIDILIDLSGHTGHNRLLVFARKPAPLQITWLGYQATTGLRAIDYRITEESLDPSGTTEAFHSEKLLRLPSSGTFSASPDSPPVNALPALEGRPFTFGCLNNPSKITEEVIALWAEILKTAPASRLMIGNSTPELAQKIAGFFFRRGVGAERLVFEPKVSLIDYLALHNQIDLALDTFPYNGGTTTFHSLWMGVPIIALEGDTSLSRVGASIMHGLGLDAFCGATKEQYVERAVHHALHLEELQQVRLTLRDQMSVAMDQLSIQVTGSLEHALRSCWKEFCAQQQGGA